MMYANKMAVAIKTNNRVLRENKETVLIPFGSEYQITLKNLNTVRAIVNIYIDGDNVVEGGLAVNAGQTIDLERSIRNGNLSEGNRFKFIERTSNIENGPRGIKLEDGIIRVEYQFESKPVYSTIFRNYTPTYDSYYSDIINKSSDSRLPTRRGPGGSSIIGAQSASASLQSYYNAANTPMASAQNVSDTTFSNNDIPKNDVGITVPGSKSTQKFMTVTMGALDPEKHVIVLKLLGETVDNKPVIKPVSVKHKPECVTCGKKNKATAKFCSTCGTALEIFA